VSFGVGWKAEVHSRLSPTVCTEPGYLEMRLKRITAAGIPPPVAEELKAHCAALAQRK